jgi:hypothetical protein
MIQREARQQMEAQRDQLIAALYANSNFSGEEGGNARAESIKGLEEHFAKAITMVYYPNAFKQKEIDWDNPFWQAAKRSQNRLKKMMETLEGQAPQQTMREAVEMSKEQIEARQDSRKSIDQI